MDESLSKAIEINNDYYIHYNKVNIGNRVSNPSIDFKKQEETVIGQVMAQYYQLFNESLQIDGQSIEALSAAYELDKDEFLSKINEKLRQKFQNELRIDKLRNLYTIAKNGNITEHLKKAIDKNSASSLSKALEVVANALTLLEDDNEGALGAVLLKELQQTKSRKFSKLGEKIDRALNKYQAENNGNIVSQQSIQSAINNLKNLSYALKEGHFKSTKNPLSVDGLSTLLSNGIISTSIAEGLGFLISPKVKQASDNAIIELVGTKTSEVQTNFTNDPSLTKITNKVDSLWKNFSITLDATNALPSGGQIKLNIGFSSKFYKGQGFNGASRAQINIGSGSGGTLKQALDTIFSESANRYLVYNYMAHNEHQHELNNLIAKRQILRLFATNGSNKDFASFMIINGYVVSIWEIMQYALNQNLSISVSQSPQTAIAISIPDRPKIQEAAQKFNLVEGKGDTNELSAWQRSHNANSVISSARIYAELHLRKLGEMYKGTT